MARQSRAFHAFYAELAANEYAPAEQVSEQQLHRLLSTIRYAYDNSAFYRRLYDEHGVHPSQLHTFDDVSARIPTVTRGMLKSASDLAVPMRNSSDAMTSGTTGSAFVFKIDRDALAMETAAIFHQWKRVGFTPGTQRIELRGFQTRPIVEYPDAAVVRFSVVNMNDNVQMMADYIDRSGIQFIHGYPSAIAKFSILLRESGRSLRQPIRAVMLASENILPWQTEVIRDVIRPAAMIGHYGTAERTVLGAWCEGTTNYHFLPHYGWFEQEESGAVIGTGFLNCATPFIRYRTSDVALDRSDKPCPVCNRSSVPLVSGIGGRLEDYLISVSGELIPPAVVTMPFKRLKCIRMVQIHQDAHRKITLRCVLAACPAAALADERRLLRDSMRSMLGTSTVIEFEDVDEIPLTKAGKFKWIDSEIASAKQASP